VTTASEMTVIVSGGALNSISSVLLPVVYWCLHSVFMCVTLVMLVHYWLLSVYLLHCEKQMFWEEPAGTCRQPNDLSSCFTESSPECRAVLQRCWFL